MAIKRPTKSRGSPSHKPAAPAPLRHVDVRPPQQLVSGELYLGWRCKKCANVIAIASTPPGAKALTDFDDQLTAIKCPHCGDEDLYRWSARSEQKHASANG
jgi:RNase P subunit RPR2